MLKTTQMMMMMMVVIEETSYDGKFTKEVQYHQLSEEDRNIIIQREWLNDVHINISQALLKKKHPYIDGMENCVLAENNSFSIQRGEFIQIVNSTGQHWVTVTSIGCPVGKVKIYDSSYRRVLRRMRDIIMKIIHCHLTHIEVILPEMQRQPNGDDCGLFAIASATALANGIDPSDVAWDVPKMREHLMKCFDNVEMELFPIKRCPGLERLKRVSVKFKNICN